MGQLTIRSNGSFQPNDTVQFTAMTHGHAAAVMEAIEWLQNTALPRAIRQDVSLKAQGALPNKGFNVCLVEKDLPCPNCGQILTEKGRGGEYPCPICHQPTVWDFPDESGKSSI